MRMSREAMARHHEEIVGAGARMLRERGIEGTSVADLMQAAGLTHGGFYRHFQSKDAFVREAVDAAFAGMEAMRNGWQGAPAKQLVTWIDQYLSEGHVAQPGLGCPIAAIGGEVARTSEDTQAAFASGIKAMTDWIAARLAGDAGQRSQRAAQLLSAMVGAVVAARACGSGALREQILDAARVQARGLTA